MGRTPRAASCEPSPVRRSVPSRTRPLGSYHAEARRRRAFGYGDSYIDQGVPVKRPTIADIARRAGVSKGAVSYALNGQPGVSEATRQRILAIARELGFTRNSAARALSGATANVVGLTLCRPARILGIEPFFMGLISGVEAELSARSYALLLHVVADPDEEIAVYRRWWGERRVDGVLLCDLRVNDRRVPVLEELDLPAVVIGGP